MQVFVVVVLVEGGDIELDVELGADVRLVLILDGDPLVAWLDLAVTQLDWLLDPFCVAWMGNLKGDNKHTCSFLGLLNLQRVDAAGEGQDLLIADIWRCVGSEWYLSSSFAP